MKPIPSDRQQSNLYSTTERAFSRSATAEQEPLTANSSSKVQGANNWGTFFDMISSCATFELQIRYIFATFR